MHAMIQNMTGLPVAISDDEAKALDEATSILAAHYKVDMKKMGVYGMWANFAVVAGGIYMPRVLHVVAVSKAQKAAKAAEHAEDVTHRPTHAAMSADAMQAAATVETPTAPRHAEPASGLADIDGLARV